jgi:putative nucleotidyltransferase with HDIG domain
MTIGVGAYLKAALKLRILRRCWRHSLSCALLSEDLAAACGIPSDQAYTSGLLHDIGRLALLVKYPGPYADLLSVVIENHFGLLSSERELFDIDHCQAGAWLAEQWNFPDELKRVVAKHHDPPRNGALDLLKLIHLSCRLADSLGFQVGDPAELEEPSQILAELPKSALSRLQIDLTTL